MSGKVHMVPLTGRVPMMETTGMDLHAEGGPQEATDHHLGVRPAREVDIMSRGMRVLREEA